MKPFEKDAVPDEASSFRQYLAKLGANMYQAILENDDQLEKLDLLLEVQKWLGEHRYKAKNIEIIE